MLIYINKQELTARFVVLQKIYSFIILIIKKGKDLHCVANVMVKFIVVR